MGSGGAGAGLLKRMTRDVEKARGAYRTMNMAHALTTEGTGNGNGWMCALAGSGMRSLLLSTVDGLSANLSSGLRWFFRSLVK